MNIVDDQKVIGIVGGMGPRAVATFFSKIVELTPAEKDWEHIHMVVDNNSKIPSRTRHYLFNEASPVPGIVESCKKLEAWPVDLIAIPCNSASYYLPLIESEVKVPIVNIMKVAADKLGVNHPEVKKCAVIGGRITYSEKTYEKYLMNNNIQYMHHSEKLQEKVENTIEYIKKNSRIEPAQKAWKEIISELVTSYGVEAVILGCTEFGCICQQSMIDDNGLAIVDSSSELASYLVNAAIRG